jgi:hypothetical protein
MLSIILLPLFAEQMFLNAMQLKPAKVDWLIVLMMQIRPMGQLAMVEVAQMENALLHA